MVEGAPMISKVTALRENILTGRAQALWQNATIRMLLQLVFLVGMGAVAALGKEVSLPLGIPGHSAVLWLGAMVLGRAVVRKDGAGTIMGISVAFWGIPMGMNNALAHNLWLYGLTGLALDLSARIPLINIRNPLGALLCGTVAHMVKFGYILVSALTASTTAHFMLVGTAKSAGLHLLFGALAGVFGWFLFWSGNKVRGSLENRRVS